MKKLLALLGLIAAAILVYIVQGKARRKNKTASSSDIAEIVPAGQEEVDTDTIKVTVQQSMAARHKEAAKIASQAVDPIYVRSDTPDDENQTLDMVSEQLDDLLKEE